MLGERKNEFRIPNLFTYLLYQHSLRNMKAEVSEIEPMLYLCGVANTTQ